MTARVISLSLFSFFVTIFPSRAPYAADSLDAKAQKLARLRSEIDQLETQLTQERENGLQSRRALLQEKSQIDILLKQEQLRLTTLLQQLERERTRVNKNNAKNLQIIPIIKQALTAHVQLVKNGLPLHQQARLEFLQRLVRQLDEKTAPIQSIAEEFSHFISDELHLGSEVGLTKQVVEIDREQYLVEVAHLGLVAMYIRAPQTGSNAANWRYAIAEKTPSGSYVFHWTTHNDQTRSIETFFNSLAAGNRTGQFSLILPPPIQSQNESKVAQ